MGNKSPGLAARLVRLPGQLILALVNATALLVIVACILGIIVLNRVDMAGERIAANVTDAALAQLDVTPSEFRSRLEALDKQIASLSDRLSPPGTENQEDVARELQALNRNLSGIRLAAKRLGDAGPNIAAAAFEQAGDFLTSTLFALRGCSAVQQNTGLQGTPRKAPDS